jgi:hypothetical protein
MLAAWAYIRQRSASIFQIARDVPDLRLESCVLLLPKLKLHIDDLLLLPQIINHRA